MIKTILTIVVAAYSAGFLLSTKVRVGTREAINAVGSKLADCAQSFKANAESQTAVAMDAECGRMYAEMCSNFGVDINDPNPYALRDAIAKARAA